MAATLEDDPIQAEGMAVGKRLRDSGCPDEALHSAIRDFFQSANGQKARGEEIVRPTASEAAWAEFVKDTGAALAIEEEEVAEAAKADKENKRQQRTAAAAASGGAGAGSGLKKGFFGGGEKKAKGGKGKDDNKGNGRNNACVAAAAVAAVAVGVAAVGVAKSGGSAA